MIEPKTSAKEILVNLVHTGIGTEDYHLFEGATLADLLRASGTSTRDVAVLVDGVSPEESLTLHDGIVVTLVPQPKSIPGEEPWRAEVTSFRDEALFLEYSEALKARREEEISEGDSKARSSWIPTLSATFRKEIPSEF
jgi:sulfur carrier protein ThiS